MDMKLSQLCSDYSRVRLLAPASERMHFQVAHIFMRDTGIEHCARVTVEDVLGWRELVLARATRVTWNTYLRHMRAQFNHAVRTGVIEKNPFLEVDLVSTPKKRKKVIEDSAIEHYRKILQNYPCGWFWWTTTLTFWYTGIRRRQLVGLRWNDLDLSQRVLLLRSGTSKNRREWMIPIPAPLAGPLEDLREKTLRTAGRGYLYSGQVFNITLFNPAYSGDEMTEEQISDFYQRLKSRHGHDGIRISAHRFRHRFATELVRRAPAKYVQELMGHSSIHTTLEYVEVELQDLADTVEKLPLMPGSGLPFGSK